MPTRDTYKIGCILNKTSVIENEDDSETGTDPLVVRRLVGYVTHVVAIDPETIMCGPAFEYTFEDFISDASDKEWDEWESEAARLELPLDYYIYEFVGQSA